MKFRKVLFWSHLAAGLLAGGVIFSMAASGILMSFQPQWVEWAEQDRRFVSAPAPGADRLPLDALAAAASAVSPKGRPSGVTLKADPAASVSVAFGKEGGNIYVNPYTGATLGGDSRTYKALHAVEEWHRWFLVRDIGKPVTGAACLFFAFLLVSGLYLWFPRRWTKSVFKASAVPSLKLKGRARDWNWHNAVGFWAAPLVLITTLTGTVIAYRWASDLVFVLTGNEPPPRPPEASPAGAKPERRDPAPRASLDVLLAKAQSQAPDWSAITLRLPQKPGGPVTASIVAKGAPKHARSQLSLDAATGEVTKWEPYADQNLGRRLRAWVVPLHTGRAGGAFGQILALLSAAAALLMVWTGAAMAWRRFFKPKAARAVPGPDGATGGKPDAAAQPAASTRGKTI